MAGIHPADLFEDVQIVELSHEEYHGCSWDSVSNSRLKVFIDDPFLYYCQFVSKELAREDTDALRFGRIVHEVILEMQGIVDGTNYTSGTLAVFRPCGVPQRDAEIDKDGEKLWIVSSPEPGVVRQSDEWGELPGGRVWNLSPDRGHKTVTAFCAFADMHIDGKGFRNIPSTALSAAGEKRGKVWEAWRDEHDGEYLMKFSEWHSVLWMRQRLRHHGAAHRRLFTGGTPEVSIVGKCCDTGIEVRTRLDFVVGLNGRTLVTDLKTSRDASPSAWERQAVGDGLHVQAAIQIGLASHVYKDAIDFAFATVDKSAPYRPEVYEPIEEFVELGCEAYLKAIRSFERCKDTGSWFHEGFGQPVDLTVPTWAMTKWQ